MFRDLFYFRDHVEWTEEEKEEARQKAKKNSSIRIPLKEQGGRILIHKYLRWIMENDPYFVELCPPQRHLTLRQANTGTNFTESTTISSSKTESGSFWSSLSCCLLMQTNKSQTARLRISRRHAYYPPAAVQTQNPSTSSMPIPQTITVVWMFPGIENPTTEGTVKKMKMKLPWSHSLATLLLSESWRLINFFTTSLFAWIIRM